MNFAKSSIDSFSAACGLRGPLEVRVSGPSEREEPFILPGPCVLVGRDEGSCLRLKHEGIRMRHAYVQVIGGRVFCVDLSRQESNRWNKGHRTTCHWLRASRG